jgi:TrwC relaxase
MSYYTAAGEPPGQWAGKAAARLGLTGQVDPGVIERLYQHDIGPGGEVLAGHRQPKAAGQREDAAVSAYLAEHPFASAVELAEVRAAARERPAPGAVLRPDDLRREIGIGTARLLPGGREAGKGTWWRRQGRGAGQEGRRHQAGADRRGQGGAGLAGTARHVHPDRAPLGPYGGVAGR